MTRKATTQKKTERAKTKKERGQSPPTAAAREERRARILKAALREFVTRGFEAASTNAIAEDAKVAKGLIFHYFGSKEELFLAVFEEVMERMARIMSEDSATAPPDLFARLHAWAMRKYRAFQADPLAYQFITMATGDAPLAVRAHLEQQIASLTSRFLPALLEGIDASRLRPGITLSQAIETIMLLGEGLMHTLMPKLANLPDKGASQIDEIGQAAWEHFARLRDGLYQPSPDPSKDPEPTPSS